MKTKHVLIIGHPGHELRAFKFIKDYKPDVYILTDGSGSTGKSRLHESVKVINSVGANYKSILSPFTDKDIYDIILQNKIEAIIAVKDLLKTAIEENGYDFILGDALEGFNPTHDLCRYLINATVKELPHLSIENYDFVLDSAPNNVSDIKNTNGFSLQLTHEELDLKQEAAFNYPELKFEVDMAIEKFGKQAFLWESFRKVNDPDQLITWNTATPTYETYGKQRVEKGLYKNFISFDQHVKPIAVSLLNV